MSQPASPIGSVEFIVKFESLQGSFTTALTNALDDVDFDFGSGDDTKKIDEILHNIRYRLRTPFSGDFEQFRTAAIPEIEYARTDKAVNDFASALRSKDMVIKKPEESDQEYQDRSKEAAEVIYDHWIEMIEESLKDENYFRKHQNKLVNLQGAIQQAMSGSWEYMVRAFVDQVLTETEVEEAMRKKLEEYGLTAIGQKRLWSMVETTVQKPGANTALETTKDFMTALSQTNLTPEQIKEAVEWDPGQWQNMPPEMKDELNSILNEYFLVAWKTQIPNAILKLWKEQTEQSDWLGDQVKIAEHGGKIHDVLNIIQDNQMKMFKKFLEDYDVPEDQVLLMTERMKKQMEDFGGWTLLPWEGKVAGALAKWFKKKLAGYDERLMLTFAAVGPTGGVGGISSTKLLESVQTMTKEELKQMILDQREKDKYTSIINMLNMIAGDTKGINFLKEKIAEVENNPTQVLGSGSGN